MDLEFSQQGFQSSSTVPLHYVFLGSPRSPLCLLGQIAAPIQVLWILSQFMRHLQEHCCLYSDINALEMIQHYKSSLLQQRAQQWILAHIGFPRSIQLNLDGHQHTIQVLQPVTVKELESAETQLVGHGCHVIVTHQGNRLPPWSQLHEGELYTSSSSSSQAHHINDCTAPKC